MIIVENGLFTPRQFAEGVLSHYEQLWLTMNLTLQKYVTECARSNLCHPVCMHSRKHLEKLAQCLHSWVFTLVLVLHLSAVLHHEFKCGHFLIDHVYLNVALFLQLQNVCEEGMWYFREVCPTRTRALQNYDADFWGGYPGCSSVTLMSFKTELRLT